MSGGAPSIDDFHNVMRGLCFQRAHDELSTEELEQMLAANRVPVSCPQEITREAAMTNRGLWAARALWFRQEATHGNHALGLPCMTCAESTFRKCKGCRVASLCLPCTQEWLPCYICFKLVQMGVAGPNVRARFEATNPRSLQFVHRPGAGPPPVLEEPPHDDDGFGSDSS